MKQNDYGYGHDLDLVINSLVLEHSDVFLVLHEVGAERKKVSE